MQTDSMVVASELERVLPNIPTLYDYEDNFYSMIEKSTEAEVISNRDMRIPLDIRPGGYFGYFDLENGDLGTGDGPTLDKGVISSVNMKLAIQWTTKSQWGTDDKRKAIQNNVKTLLAKSMKEFRRQTEAQCQTAGNGVVATVTSVDTSSGSAVVTCTTDGFGVKLLRFGQRVNVYNAARTTNRTAGGSVKISGLDLANNTFTIPLVTGLIATDVILPEGLTGSTPVGLYGVPYHANNSSSGSWLGLTRSSTPEIVANGVDANSSGLALPFARLAMNKVGDRVGADNGFKPVACMHPCQVQAYEELGQLVQLIQKQAKEENLNLYFGNGMQLAGADVKPNFMWDKTRIDFIIPSLWGRAELKAPGFYEVDGRRIFEMRGPSGGVATSQVFYLVASWNLFCKNPAAASYIYNLAKPSGY
jgi:hypothetical protein